MRLLNYQPVLSVEDARMLLDLWPAVPTILYGLTDQTLYAMNIRLMGALGEGILGKHLAERLEFEVKETESLIKTERLLRNAFVSRQHLEAK